MLQSIFKYSNIELQNIFKELNQPSYRIDQIYNHIYKNKIFDPDKMLNLSKDLRLTLKKRFSWKLPRIQKIINSKDGATKLLIQTLNDEYIESVILRYENRTALCISSQVGCKFKCAFCQTGKLGFKSNLYIEDILGQYLLAENMLLSEQRSISHIVFMGMGEPLDNYDNVVFSANKFIEKIDGFGLNPKNITISTVGLPDKIKKLAFDSKARLTVSLSSGAVRSKLMPVNKIYPLSELKKSLIFYQNITKQKLTFEFILIKDLNCNINEAKNLVKFLHGLSAKINLIPYNSGLDKNFLPPSADEIREFQNYLSNRSYPAPVRYSKGADIFGACGQLIGKFPKTSI